MPRLWSDAGTRETLREIENAVKVLDQLGKAAEAERRKILEYAAIPLVDEIQRRAPASLKPHYRYDTPKASGKFRAPKGMGRVAAKYVPGNLRRSFRILPLRRTRDVIIGPKYGKGGGTFGGARADGYYAAFVEYGTVRMPARPFLRPSVAIAGKAVVKRIELGYKVMVKKFLREN